VPASVQTVKQETIQKVATKPESITPVSNEKPLPAPTVTIKPTVKEAAPPATTTPGKQESGQKIESKIETIAPTNSPKPAVAQTVDAKAKESNTALTAPAEKQGLIQKVKAKFE